MQVVTHVLLSRSLQILGGSKAKVLPNCVTDLCERDSCEKMSENVEV